MALYGFLAYWQARRGVLEQVDRNVTLGAEQALAGVDDEGGLLRFGDKEQLGAYLLAGRALRPVDRITRTAGAIDGGNLGLRIGYRGPDDEVGRLAATLDGMLERLDQAMERERCFTADAAHELRTPLTALKGNLEVTLSRPRSPEDYAQSLAGSHAAAGGAPDRPVHGPAGPGAN